MKREDALWYLGGQLDNYFDARVPKVLIITFPRNKEERVGFDILRELFPEATLCDNDMRDRWALRGVAASDFALQMLPYCYVAREEMRLASTVPGKAKWYRHEPVLVTPVGSTESVPYDTLELAAAALGASVTQMQTVLRGVQHTCAGHTVAFARPQPDADQQLRKRKAADGELKELRDAERQQDLIPDQQPPAYYGGLFEHHGQILPNNGSLSLAMVHKEPSVCNALQRRYGGRVENVPNNKAHRGQKRKIKCWQWTLDETEAAAEALRSIGDYLPSRRVHIEAAFKDMSIPPITHISTERMLHELRRGCYERQQINWSTISEDQRWWIGGQHDGDGCSGFYNNSHHVMVTKARPGFGCLEHLLSLLGGHISAEQPQRGNQEAKKQWYLVGQAALDFCVVMRDYCFLKRPQLELAADFPYHNFWLARVVPVVGTNIETGERVVRTSAQHNFKQSHELGRHTAEGHAWSALPNEWESERPDEEIRAANLELDRALRALKHVEHGEINRELPLPYIAGFVDADGCISLTASGSQSHSVSQKYIAICEAFQQQYGGGVTSNWEKPVHQWYTHVAFAGKFLADIAPFLVEKIEQARLILDMQPGDEARVRSEVQALHGRRLYYASLGREAEKENIDNVE